MNEILDRNVSLKSTLYKSVKIKILLSRNLPLREKDNKRQNGRQYQTYDHLWFFSESDIHTPHAPIFAMHLHILTMNIN